MSEPLPRKQVDNFQAIDFILPLADPCESELLGQRC